jgi:hypothetical protein
MRTKSGSNDARSRSRATEIFCILVITGLIAGCAGFGGTSAREQSLLETQMALGVQATMIAQQNSKGADATIQAQQATLVAQAAQATVMAKEAAQAAEKAAAPKVDAAATLASQQVELAIRQTEAARPTQAPAPTAEVKASTQTPQAQPTADFKALMKKANILIYEDMTGVGWASRVVKPAVEKFNLNYTDTGSAMGRFKEQILAGGPGGKPWDLVIVAAERHEGVSGEFFEYLNTALNNGSSVILEVYYLESFANGKAAMLLSRCGVEFERDWGIVPIERRPMFPLVSENPVLHMPNDRITLTMVTDTWFNDDIGDFIRRSPGANTATLLTGTLANERNSHATVAVCENGKFILQTFSSHIIANERIIPLWENYIYNALQARFQAAP